MIELQINGKTVSAQAGDMIIEVADAYNIYIPRFCYHNKLSIAANCRMCLVEVEKVGKPLPACATPVTPDMQVYTASKKAMEAQRAVMEFLLINHPLDCPICDQGGECELQDLAMGYGGGHSHFSEPKRAVFSEDIGPLIDTEMTRCIHCTRCVRFGEEIAGLRELGATGRGEDMQIGTYVKHFIRSEISGNIIDLCPVGALNSKPAQYSERSWEMVEVESIAPHDAVGSHIYIHAQAHERIPQRTIKRVVPREADNINETWLSDRDRFAYEGLTHPDRVLQPRMKKNGKWIEVEWERALIEIADRLKAIHVNQGGEQIAALASPSCTNEAYYLLQKLLRDLGSNNIDHRLAECDFEDQNSMPLFPNMGQDIASFETMESIVLIGANTRFEQPMLAHRINKASQNGAAIFSINPIDHDFVFPCQHKIIHHDMVNSLAELAKALGISHAGINEVTPSEQAKAMADVLKAKPKTTLVLGEFALTHNEASDIRAVVKLIADHLNAVVSLCTPGSNAAGAWALGCVPHRGVNGKPLQKPGKTARELLGDKPVRAYLLLNTELEYDTPYAASAVRALQQAGLVVCMTPFATIAMQEYADFILPTAPFSENGGTLINGAGQWQTLKAASLPHHQAKPAWKVLRVLGNLLELPDYDYTHWQAVRDDIQTHCANLPLGAPSTALEKPLRRPSGLIRFANKPIYRTDALVRRALALQAAQVVVDPRADEVYLHPNTAAQYQLTSVQRVLVTQGSVQVCLDLHIDEACAEGVVALPSALDKTVNFGEWGEPLHLKAERV